MADAENSSHSTASKSPENRGSPASKEETKGKESELEKYWKAVKENPNDFTGWTYLLQYVEQEDNMEDARKAYDDFFCHYPYCYGYWKKYTDLEKRHGNVDRAIEVFENGLKAIVLSSDLWLHYINFYTTEFGTKDDATENTRKLYERAVEAAGTDFRSDKLWEAYIQWETAQENWKNVTHIYDRLMKIPTQLYSHHFESFKTFVSAHHPKEILDLDEFLKLRREVVAAKPSITDPEEEAAAADIGPPGDDVPPGLEGETVVEDEKEAKKVRELVIQKREAIFKENEAEVSKRWTFEEAIRRPYFHVKPLERAQLKNWRDYLDFEVEQGDHKRVGVLFERCMIACALYEDFWMKYAKYLEAWSVEDVRNVYRRACSIHLPRKPNIHLAWAAFEERQNCYDSAWEILSNIEKNQPELVQLAMRRISLERRQSNTEEVERLFSHYIEKATNCCTRNYFACKYARFLHKVKGDVDEAKRILNEALEKDRHSEKLLLQLLDVEYQRQPVEVEPVMDVFARILKSEVAAEFKVKVSQRRMEFLEDFGMSIKRITEAYDEHQKLVKDLNADRKRRHMEATAHQQPPLPDGEPPEKKSRTEATVNGGEGSSHTPAPVPVTAPPTAPTADGHAYSYPHWPAYGSSGYQYHSQWPGYQQHYNSYYPSY